MNKPTYIVQKIISVDGKKKYQIRIQPSLLKRQDGTLVEFESEKDAITYIEKLTK